MSRVFKAKQSWRTTPVPEERPEQLSLGLPTAASSARAELKDSAGRQWASGAELRKWPEIGSRVLVKHLGYWTLGGVLDEVYDHEYASGSNGSWKVKRARVRLDAKQEGISHSLSASLPAVLSDVALSQLRRP